jgi:monoamine oxidase
MAGQAKIVAVYDQPYWRMAGLSGDAMSQYGPMAEIHDASPARGGPYGLFGFVGVPANIRKQYREDLLAAAREQLVRLFGPELANPVSLTLQDWAHELLTATRLDHVQAGRHPSYGMPLALNGLWDGRLQFGSTEMAPMFGGYLEGALEAAEFLANPGTGNLAHVRG